MLIYLVSHFVSKHILIRCLSFTTWTKWTRDWLELNKLTKNSNLKKELNSQQTLKKNSFNRNQILERHAIKQKLLQRI